MNKKINFRRSALMALLFVLAFAAIPITANAETAITLKTYIDSYHGGGISAAISGNTLTVSGAITGANVPLELDLDANVTIVWNAQLSTTTSINLITITGNGTFVVASGTVSAASGNAINATGTLTVNGGTVSATSGRAINATGTVTVSGGEVKNNSSSNATIHTTNITSNAVLVSGGLVENAGSSDVIRTNAAACTITVSGGEVKNTGTGRAIFGSGTGVTAKITGGTVTSKVSGNSGTVTCRIVEVSGTGIVTKTTGASGSAIYASGTGDQVTVSGSAQVTSNINAIYTSGNVTLTGGTVTTTSGTAIEAQNIYATGGAATVNGNIVGNTGFGVEASTGAIVTVNGNITGSAGGVKAGTGAQVTVDGTLTGTLFIDFAGTVITASDYEAITTKAGYREYTDGVSTVWVILNDVTAPVLSGGSVNRTSDAAATIGFTTDEAGAAYYLVLNSGDPVPTEAQVKAGTLIGAVTVGANSGKAVVLTAGAKDIYVVIMDAAGNLSVPLQITVAAMPPPPPTPPHITGPTTMTLTTGYTVTSTGAYTITGTAPVTVTKTSGDSHITWNTTNNCLDIATGLSAGTYPVTLTASNGISPNASLTFTLTVTALTYYSVKCETYNGGSMLADKVSTAAGETVTLTLTPNDGHVLNQIWAYTTASAAVSVPLNGSGNTRSFTMPAANVTVIATFYNPTYQTAWDAALKIIESTDFSQLQKDANTAVDVRYRLANLINALIIKTGIVISPNDIVVFDFSPATAGEAGNTPGTNGYFEFRVTPSEFYASAYSSGIITAMPYNDVANDVWPAQNGSLKTWTTGGRLYVTGLTPGTTWCVYTLNGVMRYNGVATGNQADIALPESGVYIITNGVKTAKTIK